MHANFQVIGNEQIKCHELVDGAYYIATFLSPISTVSTWMRISVRWQS